MLPVLLSRSARLKLGASLITPPGSIGDNPTKLRRFHKWLTTCRFFMWHSTILRRARRFILILIGRSRAEIAFEEFLMAFEKTEASLAALSAAASSVVSEVGTLQSAAANQPDLAALDTDLSAKVDAVTSQLNGVLPPPSA